MSQETVKKWKVAGKNMIDAIEALETSVMDMKYATEKILISLQEVDQVLSDYQVSLERAAEQGSEVDERDI